MKIQSFVIGLFFFQSIAPMMRSIRIKPVLLSCKITKIPLGMHRVLKRYDNATEIFGSQVKKKEAINKNLTQLWGLAMSIEKCNREAFRTPFTYTQARHDEIIELQQKKSALVRELRFLSGIQIQELPDGLQFYDSSMQKWIYFITWPVCTI